MSVFGGQGIRQNEIRIVAIACAIRVLRVRTVLRTERGVHIQALVEYVSTIKIAIQRVAAAGDWTSRHITGRRSHRVKVVIIEWRATIRHHLT